MKLRLRSTASNETLKIEVSSDCTLAQLKRVIADRIGAVSSPVTISLNRKDEIIGAPDEPLRSLGVASGDLLFYTTGLSVFVTNTQTLGSDAAGSSDFGMIDCGNSEGLVEPKVVEKAVEGRIKEPEVEGRIKEPEVEGTGLGDGDMVDVRNNENIEFEQSGDGVDEEIMDVVLAVKRRSTPHFLKNVLKEGQGEELCGYGLLVVAVQAVLLESGFVRLDLETGAPVHEFLVPKADTPAMTLTLRYTLVELIESKSVASEFVTVKMFKRGSAIFVYGGMRGNKNECYTLRLDELVYAKNMELELRKSREGGEDCGGVFLIERHDCQVFKFYKEVKDKLALPLLIDICDKVGLPQPPCLMLLPTELKLKIFERVGGADLAKLACQCSEFQYLTADNSLWKKKYVEEFGNGGGDESTNWKQKFILSWKRAKEMDLERMHRHNRSTRMNRPLRYHRPPPFGTPFIIGGDYDLYPFGEAGPYTSPFGSSSNRQPSFPYPSFQPSRRFSPNRNLDGGSLL